MNVVPEGGYACGRDAVSQEVELSDDKDALLQVEGHPVGGEDVERCPEVIPMQCCSLVLLCTPSSSKKEKNVI
jgi:hypothetical protein